MLPVLVGRVHPQCLGVGNRVAGKADSVRDLVGAGSQCLGTRIRDMVLLLQWLCSEANSVTPHHPYLVVVVAVVHVAVFSAINNYNSAICDVCIPSIAASKIRVVKLRLDFAGSA